jgi:transcriptional repressor NrdR
MRCPHCESENTHVIDTTHDARGGIRRRRECETCNQRFSTYERAILSTPLIIKKDNSREEFDREKLLTGIRLACSNVQYPEEIERLAGEVETGLPSEQNRDPVTGDQRRGHPRPKDLARPYIRYAIVYLPLGNLKDIQKEINQLLITEGE